VAAADLAGAATFLTEGNTGEKESPFGAGFFNFRSALDEEVKNSRTKVAESEII
jgi:hypothetical protein